MRIAHTALWTRDLDAAAGFFETYFGATVGEPYHSKNRVGFTSRFANLPGAEDQIELMSGPWVTDATEESVGWAYRHRPWQRECSRCFGGTLPTGRLSAVRTQMDR